MAFEFLSDIPARFVSWRHRETVLRCGLIMLLTPVAFRMLLHEQYNLLAAIVVFTALYTLGLFARNTAIALTFAYLLLLGDIRRIGEMAYGFPKADLLIIVGPAIAVLLAVPILLRVRLTDNLTKVVFALLVLMGLETLNPLQGSITAGLPGGILFYIAPILWFWIGRQDGTGLLVDTVLFKVVVPISCLAAVLGLYQTFVGFLPWEEAWIKFIVVRLAALGIGGHHVRPFGFSTNGADYSYLLAIGCACCTGAMLTGKRAYGLLLLLLFPMLILASVRSTLVKFVFATALQWALLSRGRAWGVRVVIFLVAAAGVIAFSSSQVADTANRRPDQASTAQLLLSHEAGLFKNPQHSSLNGHGTLILEGLARGIKNPVGYGLGASTVGVGGTKATGSSDLGSSELDVTDAFTSLGLPGGLLYFAWIFFVLQAIVRTVRQTRSTTAVSLAGVVLCSLGSWTGGPGGYSLAPIYCFLMGSLALSTSSLALVSRSTERHPVHLQPEQAGQRNLGLVAGNL